MNFSTNKKGVWIVQDGQPKLIWEDELTDNMELLDLELTPINSALYNELKETVYEEKYQSYYSTISEDEDIRNEIIQKFQQQAEEEHEQDSSIDVEARVQELIDNEFEIELNKKVDELLIQETESRLDNIKAENNYKLSLMEQTQPASVESELVEINEEDDKFLKSVEYLPDFLRDRPVFKDATKLLDILISKSDDETLKGIYEAYVDTLYKYPGYEKLSYGARITLLQEKGFGYIVDLLIHMYDEDYEKEVAQRKKEGTLDEMDSYEVFVQKKTDKALANITMLYNLLYILKGQTLGLELALQLVNVPSFVYFPWNIVSKECGEWDSYDTLPLPGGDVEVKKGDCYNVKTNDITTWYMFNGVAWHEIDHPDSYKRKRERFTATLDIRGLESNSHRTDLQKRISIFVKNYMLPYISVTVRYTHSVEPLTVDSTRGRSLLTMFVADEMETRYQHKKLKHKVSDEGWGYTGLFDLEQINFGLGKNKKPFKGSAVLSKSYVQDPDGTIHYLYGANPTFAHIISGDAKPKATEEGTINNYDGDYLGAPLRKKVDIDFTTGDQINPYTENGVFYRDTIIKFYQTLVLEAIHLARTIEQMHHYEVTGSVPNIEDLPATEVKGACYRIGNTPIRYLYNGTEWVELSYPDLLVEDFEKQYDEAEVWLGRTTSLDLQSGYNHNLDEPEMQGILYEKYRQYLQDQGLSEQTIRHKLQAATRYLELYAITKSQEPLYQRDLAQKEIDTILEENPELTQLTTYKNFFEFTTSEYDTREHEGEENTHLVFCEEKLDDKYTGIGELGILGSNDYFIYNGMILYHDDRLKQVGEEKNWIDIGSSHATSSDYYIPAILASNETVSENRGSLKGIKGEEVLSVQRDDNNLQNYRSHTKKHEQIIVETLDENMSNENLDKEQVRSFNGDWYEIDEYWDLIEADKWTQVTGFVNEFYSAFGICDGRLYKISLNPLHYFDDEPTLIYQILDDDKEWTFITGAAYSGTYEAYGIKNKKLYRIDVEGIITEMKTEDIDTISGIENTTYTNNKLTYKVLNKPYEQPKFDSVEITYKQVTEDEITYTTIDKVFFNDEEQEVTQDGNSFYTSNLIIHYSEETLQSIFAETDLYRAYITFNNNTVTNYTLNERQEIIGWEDKISRYHHNNDDYFTYGICNNDLYVINNKNIKKINDERVYTDVCGFYNEKSARTVAFALSNKKLYKLENETVTLMDDRDWDEIHGCTVTYNTYILGRSEGKIYKINARDIIQIDDRTDWISIFGRTTTSSTDTATCYGYAIRQTPQGKKLYEITRTGVNIISGFWKINGSSQIQYLEDYNIDNLKCNVLSADGTQIVNVWNNEQEIKEHAIDDNHVLSDYDIYVSYKTKGFDNNERYTIRCEVDDMNYIYIHPSQCRYHVYEDHCYDIFDTNTGLMSNFITRNVEQIGGDVIGGDGTASRFAETNTYLILPEVEDLNKIVISFTCTLQSGMNPIILDDHNCGIYYGEHQGVYGIYVMHEHNGQMVLQLISSGNEGSTINSVVTFNIVNDYSNITFSHTDNHYESSEVNNDFVYVPKYLGGNGTIFGDASIYLKESMVFGEENIRLFDNGKYISIDTLEQDVTLDVITNKTQDTQKVIEVHGENNYELRMDELYSQLDVECTTDDLEVSTNYNEQLQHDPYEGTTYSTITYKGDYQLDEEKVVQAPNGIDFKELCDFSQTGVASNLNGMYNINFRLTNQNNEIKIKTGDIVDNQILFTTEEGESYTNRYLLQSDISAISDVEVDTVPSGIIYELSTDKPHTIARTIIFNNDHFNIDNSKIFNYGYYYFDDYNATLKFQPIEIYNYLTGEDVYQDIGATIKLDMSNPSMNEMKINSTKIKLKALNADEKLFTLDSTVINTIQGDQYYKIDTIQHFISYNNQVINEINHSTHDIDKDKLQYKDGKCSNYSKWRYHEFIDTPTSLTLCVTNGDDTSINQCILGSTNSFGIIDNEWTIVKGNEIYKTGIIAYDSMTAYIKFENDNVYYSENGDYFDLIFEDFTLDTVTLGYGRMGSDVSYWNYNGSIDLSRSKADEESLYLMDQTSIISRSTDDENYTVVETVETHYTVDEIILGYKFTGTLDLYESNLLEPYELKWVEDYHVDQWSTEVKTLDEAIKADMAKADPDYKPEEDQNTYGMDEYGVQLVGTPKRWDQITVTYTTVDKAYYMQPNTEYTLKMNVQEDHESGSTLMNVEGEPTWNLGNVSDFENGYLTYTLEAERYIVVKFNLSGNNEALCCFLENDELENNSTAPCIYVENNKVKILDGEVKELFDVEQNTYYLKLYNSLDKIEYSLDGETFIETNVEREFSGYAPLAFGIGFINGEYKPLEGSIDLTKSYVFTDNKIDLFKYYKKIFTYINDGEDHALTLEPLLTIRDYTTFCQMFDGSIDFYQSNLCLPNTRHWMANKISVYLGDVLQDEVIRDEINIDPMYTLVNEESIVDLEDLYVHVDETPQIGSQLLLTYNSWYLFRKKDTEYQFNVKYSDKTYLTWNEKGDATEHLIIEMPLQPLNVNFGYEFNGTLSVIDSTRSGMALCDYQVYYTYSIKYKKQSEENWKIWYEWVMEKANALYERIGYDLKGTHYLESSVVETEAITTPFITFFDPEYVRPVGNISFSPDRTGTVSSFDENSYLAMVMDKIEEGSIVSFWIHTSGDISDQDVGSFVKIKDRYFKDGNNNDLTKIARKAKRDYTYILQYLPGGAALNVETIDNMLISDLMNLTIENFVDAKGKISARILGYNIGSYAQVKKPAVKKVSILPYNETYYTDNIDDLRIYYRKVIPGDYDHFTHSGNVTWYETNWIKGDITYLKENLNIYYAQVPFGYQVSDGNYVNQGEIEYNAGDIIEFKIVGKEIHYMQCIPYSSMILKMKGV